MSKWTGLEKPITGADAEAEPEAQRLFSQKRPPISRETRALFAQIERERGKRQGVG